ncbi:MAG: Glutaredoxin-3 [Alphaproteobacteria bacterium MarineAlpha10_Bin3]|jgi:glutaredoxin 3|nr:MAG: Glutaredoxin-3 [Alphaproteobacteria bacterium MarineAlpha10_Bin3]PPR72902.1 MAG: Glutaredoxin-3 [Alphaproteobacteria bacterium MarineAlpha4_Bin1]
MAKIEIYTSPFCGFSYSAKNLLGKKNADFEELDVMMHPTRKREMVARAGGRTSVPQIFIDGEHIGGCDELYALEASGALDVKLAGAG